MSNYIVITDYEAKDNLLTGNPAKLIKGAEFTAEFNAIATAIATKADSLSPTLTTPNLGVATATSINNVTITAPATGSTLTIANSKTLTASNSLTLAGVDGTTLTFQGTDTYVGRATTDTLTNKTLTSPAINGTVTTTGLTLPAFTLGGTITSNGQSFSGTIANLGTVTTVDINGGTIDGTTQASGTINGPIAVGGTWTAAAAWTLPALTLGGNVSSSGNPSLNIGTGAITAGTATCASFIPSSATVPTNGMYLSAANTLGWATNSTNTMTLNASGNLGLGVTPSAWSTHKILQVGAWTSFGSFTGSLNAQMMNNAYWNGSAYIYIGSSQASYYSQTVGIHSWWGAASGTAGNTVAFTQVLAVEKDKSLALQGATSQTGTGITFPATQSASSDANTLDDYEEGTWTPDTANMTVVGANSSTGTYTKVGRVVHCRALLSAVTSIASTANTSYLTGLPFTPASGSVCAAVNNSTVSFGNGVVATNSRVYTPTWTATNSIWISFSYEV